MKKTTAKILAMQYQKYIRTEYINIISTT